MLTRTLSIEPTITIIARRFGLQVTYFSEPAGRGYKIWKGPRFSTIPERELVRLYNSSDWDGLKRVVTRACLLLHDEMAMLHELSDEQFAVNAKSA